MSSETKAVGPAEALKRAAETFREYEAHHRTKHGAKVAEFHANMGARLTHQERQTLEELMRKVARNRQMATLCEAALKAIEDMAAEALERPPTRKGPTDAGFFQLGFAYGQVAGAWEALPDEAKALVEAPQNAPETTWEGAWAHCRAALAAGGANAG